MVEVIVMVVAAEGNKSKINKIEREETISYPCQSK